MPSPTLQGLTRKLASDFSVDEIEEADEANILFINNFRKKIRETIFLRFKEKVLVIKSH